VRRAFVAMMFLGLLVPMGRLGKQVYEGRVEGTVVQANGVAVSDARVTLQAQLATQKGSSTVTDNRGEFAFGGINPGRYTLTVTRDGFLRSVGQLTLEPGTHISLPKIIVRKYPVITGHILDEAGQPVGSLNVNLLRLVYDNKGRPVWQTVARNVYTDATGKFEQPIGQNGEYYLRVHKAGTAMTAYFPGTRDSHLAAPMVVRDDRDIDASFHLSPLKGARIRGRVVAESPKYSKPTLVLLPVNAKGPIEERPDLLANHGSYEGGGDTFEIANVIPGSYKLIAYQPSSGCCIAEKEIYIGDQDADIGDFNVRSGVSVSGTLDLPASIHAERLRISLIRSDNFQRAVSISTRDRTFSLNDVPDGAFEFAVSGLPETAYVAEVRQSGRPVGGQGLTVSGAQVGEVEIIVRADGLVMRGTVAIENPENQASVALVPLSFPAQAERLRATLATPRTGEFAIGGIVPGSYRLLAWERRAPSPSAYESVSFFLTHAPRGTLMRLDPGAKVGRVTVKPVTVP